MNILLQVNGKLIKTVDTQDDEYNEEEASIDVDIINAIGNKTIAKIVMVPKRLINFITR
jgi:hypothetical protein